MRFEFPIVGAGLPTMRHPENLPEGGFFGLGHMSIFATHAAPTGRDTKPGVTFFSQSNEHTRELFPFDWQMTYMVSLTTDQSHKRHKAKCIYTNKDVEEMEDSSDNDVADLSLIHISEPTRPY